MNKIMLIGNLTRYPELSETLGGVSYCNFSIAVSRSFANADGERETDFFDVVVEDFDFLTPKARDNDESEKPPKRGKKPPLEEIDDDDIPF